MNTFLYIFHRIIRKASGEIKAMTGNMGRGEGVETKGRTFTSRAERWEGGREEEKEGEGRVYQIPANHSTK